MLISSHPNRASLGTKFGATDIINEPGQCAIDQVMAMTGGLGAHSVLECVGHTSAMETAIGVARPGGTIGRVGVPQESVIPGAATTLFRNVTISVEVAPVRAYIPELLPDVLNGVIEPGHDFDRVGDLDSVPAGYVAMNEQTAIKALIAFA